VGVGLLPQGLETEKATFVAKGLQEANRVEMAAFAKGLQ
jgi:hypothetical protein